MKIDIKVDDENDEVDMIKIDKDISKYESFDFKYKKIGNERINSKSIKFALSEISKELTSIAPTNKDYNIKLYNTHKLAYIKNECIVRCRVDCTNKINCFGKCRDKCFFDKITNPTLKDPLFNATPFIRKLLETMLEGVTTNKEMVSRLANITIFLNMPEATIFRERIKNEYYLPESIPRLTIDDKLPEINSNIYNKDEDESNLYVTAIKNTINKKQKDMVKYYITLMVRINNPTMSIPYGQLPKHKIEISHIKCDNEEYVNKNIPKSELKNIVHYKFNNTIRCYSLTNLYKRFLKANLTLPDKPEETFSVEFVENFNKKFNLGLFDKGYLREVFADKYKPPKLKPKRKIPEAKGFWELIVRDVKDLENELTSEMEIGKDETPVEEREIVRNVVEDKPVKTEDVCNYCKKHIDETPYKFKTLVYHGKGTRIIKFCKLKCLESIDELIHKSDSEYSDSEEETKEEETKEEETKEEETKEEETKEEETKEEETKEEETKDEELDKLIVEKVAKSIGDDELYEGEFEDKLKLEKSKIKIEKEKAEEKEKRRKVRELAKEERKKQYTNMRRKIYKYIREDPTLTKFRLAKKLGENKDKYWLKTYLGAAMKKPDKKTNSLITTWKNEALKKIEKGEEGSEEEKIDSRKYRNRIKGLYREEKKLLPKYSKSELQKLIIDRDIEDSEKLKYKSKQELINIILNNYKLILKKPSKTTVKPQIPAYFTKLIETGVAPGPTKVSKKKVVEKKVSKKKVELPLYLLGPKRKPKTKNEERFAKLEAKLRAQQRELKKYKIAKQKKRRYSDVRAKSKKSPKRLEPLPRRKGQRYKRPVRRTVKRPGKKGKAGKKKSKTRKTKSASR